MKFQQVYYVVDDLLRILWIGGEWDDFALANAGSGARANGVLSTRLLDHVAGATTRSALADLISAVREEARPLRLDYRCDSPQMLRRFQLTIQPMRGERVLLVHDLRDARSFEEPLPHWHADRAADAQKCSFCGAVHHPLRTDLEGVWAPPEDLGAQHPEAVSYVICPSCSAEIEELIASLRQHRAPRSLSTGGFGPAEED
ncbi:hypothetical protein SAMN05877809_101213 [Rhodobacter sp. JA431]|uniref:hypothetical protein n=1 Tax=Rhodobacter sp. JA431 TaxID=570013 RepID=UPI000BD97382|nr:hypothetical protein [Rhodobacter sp. JA431]SOB90602.1 hypothetical protein SAMN05877809_101213 [Rhodobacter sp. JA431]